MKINLTNVLILITISLIIVLIIKQLKTDSFSNLDGCLPLSYVDCLANSGTCTYNSFLKKCQTSIQTIKPMQVPVKPVQIQTPLPQILQQNFQMLQTAIKNQDKTTITSIINKAKTAPLVIKQQIKSFIETLPQNEQQQISSLITF